MADKPDINVNVQGAGCLFLFAAIIIASCIGTIYVEVYGWLTFGVILLIWAIAHSSGKAR